jgi:hypothetical protein
MPPRVQIVQRVEDDAEASEPRDVELRVLDVVVVRLDLDVGVELERRLLGNLQPASARTLTWWDIFMAYLGLGLLDVLIAEEKLAVQVAEIDGVEVDDVDVAKAREHEILEQLAPDAAGAHHQNARLFASASPQLLCACAAVPP